MTVCNMSIEAGARAGMIAPDQTRLIEYHAPGGRYAPQGADVGQAALAALAQALPSDPDARATTAQMRHRRDAQLRPMVTFGTNPGMVDSQSTATVPREWRCGSFASALDYMQIEARQAVGRHGRRRGLHRQLHQLAHQRPARCGPTCCADARLASRVRMLVVPRFARDQARGRARRAGPGLPRCRRGMARTGLLDVHRDERRSGPAGTNSSSARPIAISRVARDRVRAPCSQARCRGRRLRRRRLHRRSAIPAAGTG